MAVKLNGLGKDITDGGDTLVNARACKEMRQGRKEGNVRRESRGRRRIEDEGSSSEQGELIKLFIAILFYSIHPSGTSTKDSFAAADVPLKEAVPRTPMPARCGLATNLGSLGTACRFRIFSLRAGMPSFAFFSHQFF